VCDRSSASAAGTGVFPRCIKRGSPIFAETTIGTVPAAGDWRLRFVCFMSFAVDSQGWHRGNGVPCSSLSVVAFLSRASRWGAVKRLLASRWGAVERLLYEAIMSIACEETVTQQNVPNLVPARMLNECAYCPRLAYLEWVQGEFAINGHDNISAVERLRPH
jgi:hypothetical protein